MLKVILRVGGTLAVVMAIAMILAVAAQAQEVDNTPDRFQKSKEPVYLSPQAGQALLYVTRPEYVRFLGLGDFKVFVDDKAAGWLPQRSYLAVPVEPGRRLLWGPSRNEVLRVDFAAGKTYLLVLNEIYVKVGNNSGLDRTWWSERDPEEIKSLVSAGKLEYVTTPAEPMAELSKEAANKYARTNEKTKDVAEFSLPASFETVWYRPGKKKVMLKPFEATGTLTISRETIEYQSDKKTMVIPVKDVQKVSLGAFVTFGFANKEEWDIVKFTTDGAEETVGFRDGHAWGSGGNTGLIYKALLIAIQGRVYPSPSETSAALSGQSASQPGGGDRSASPPTAESAAGAENQPASPTSGSAAVQRSTAAALPVQGKTLGSPLLQRDTLRTINTVDIAMGSTVSDCKVDRRVLKMEITGQPVGVKFEHERMVAGSWEERWTIDRCGTQVAYNITYRSDGHGGTDISARMAGVPGQEKETEVAALPPQAAAGATPASAASPSQPASTEGLPEGYVVFEGRKDQFTIAIPKDWAGYDQARMLEGQGTQQIKGNSFNMILFYPSQDGKSPNDMSIEALRKIDTGEVPSFFVQRLSAGDGMSCSGFSEKAQKQVLKLIGSEDAFTRGATVMEAPHAEVSPVAGCKGVRVRGSGQPRRSSFTTKYDVYAASDGVVLFLFSLRSPAERFEKNAEAFQKAMGTARLTAAK